MKYILGVVVLLIATTLYFISRPEPEFQAGRSTVIPADEKTAPEAADSTQGKAAPTPDAQRRIAMQAEFDKLQQARQNLESRLSRLKVILWDVQLPATEGDAVTQEMKNGYALLKDRKLLGSYSGLDEISNELGRVEYINNYLRAVEDEYRSARRQ